MNEEAPLLDFEKVSSVYKKNSKNILFQFNRLMPFMISPADSLSELVEASYYSRPGFPDREIIKVLRESNVAQILDGYFTRIKNNTKKGIDTKILPGDISMVLKSDISSLDNYHQSQVIVSIGRRAYTGQSEQTGSNPGYGPI